MSVNRLRVTYTGWGERWPLGTLALAGGALLFEYTPEAVARGIEPSPLRAPLPRPGAAPVAITGPRHTQGLPAFIADALPDGWGMLLMDRAFRKAGRDPRSVSVLERLAVVGESALGALAFEPADPLPEGTSGTLSLAALAREVQAVLADDAGDTPVQQLQRLLQVGGSPQGARPKALLRWQADHTRFAMSKDGAAGEPWLIKFPAQGEHAEVCAVEELYARLARAGGMSMPASRHFALAGRHAAFGVRRFDRVPHPAPDLMNTGEEVRVPMLSLAALLDADYRLPALDYSTVLLATARLTGDYRETLKAFGRCVFNVLTHNRDDHAKNFAYLLGADGRWRLSPAFDLTFSHGPGGEHSTSIAGEGRTPGRRELLQVAREGGVKPKDAEHVIDHWLTALQPAPELLADLPIRAATLRQMREALTPVWQAVQRKEPSHA
ncbi:MAG: type II toxin-antitoxin system HipA family toxin [Pseudomonadota bacterium]|nr:type II toxin-antitoxin system HipA family toxin [Pseudomonadota bacterium]